MKTKMIKLSVIAVFGVLLMGCTKDFDEINTNPNASADAPITNILAYSIRYTCDTYFDAWADMNEPSTYGGHLAKKQYIDEARYVTRSTVVANNWHYLYITMNNVRDVRNRAAAEGLSNMENVAKIWEAVIMQLGTDRWRDLPYSEAIGLDQGIVAPKYDTQEEIYPALMDLLKEAADGLSAGGTDDLGIGDILFFGDTDAWLRLANSLR
ncbi:MAG: SusD/RagB family nutrient-binding outer membrane lipoprotein, partial [Bacteroidales bacterium]|nr:SusD/RagB family nutrient-binding outer membrane lipoprotein [Bacteroidales bacterium]MDD4481578.1 SusD/RagB family nutrient-binding outer membrane lipoprotein [Bacteroidales bacterium]